MRTLLFVYMALFILLASSCQQGGSGSEATVSALNPSGAAYNQFNGYSAYNYNNGGYNGGYGGGYNGGYGGGYGGNCGGYSGCGGYNGAFNYYNNNAYLCNCGAGMIPTYNGSYGLGCVQSSYLQFGVYGYAYLSWGGAAWSNLPQLYQYNYAGAGSRCYNGAVQSCTVGSNPQTCPAGNVCRPSYSGSSIGLCVTSYR